MCLEGITAGGGRAAWSHGGSLGVLWDSRFSTLQGQRAARGACGRPGEGGAGLREGAGRAQ